MNNRRSQNSILFLTTLGVYLGLVLVGATPQVLAQAATAKQFSVKDEVGRKDDLEKKPENGADEIRPYFEGYLSDVSDFLSDLKKLYSIDKFTPGFDQWKTEKTVYLPCPETGTLVSEGPKLDIDHWLKPAIIDAQFRIEGWTSLGTCLPGGRFQQAGRSEARAAGLSLSYDKHELKYEISITRSNANDAIALLEQFRTAIQRLDSAETDLRLKALRNNTVFSASDNQVFIITRLPRAGLDSLLATDAK